VGGVVGHAGGLRGLVDEAGPAPGPSGGGLKHSDGPWTGAAGVAETLRAHLAQVKSEFAAAHEGVAGGGQGLSVIAVLSTVRTSWERRIETAADECGSLAGGLRAVAREQGGNDAAIRAALAGAGVRAGR